MRRARGLKDEIINLTDEMHLFHHNGENVPGGSFNGLLTYSYAGPGTKFVQRIREGYKGVNELDAACKIHDLFYYLYKDVVNRNKADSILMNDCKRILSKYGFYGDYPRLNSESLERFDPDTKRLLIDALTVMHIMATKERFGL